MNRYCFVLLVPLFWATVSQARPSLAVLDIKTNGVEKRFGPLLAEVLSAEIDASKTYDVISASDITSMLGFESDKQLMGCTESECLAEIAGALGADLIIVGDVGKIGDTYLINLKLIDVGKAKTLARVSRTLNGAEDILIPGMRAAAQSLLKNVQKQPNSPKNPRQSTKEESTGEEDTNSAADTALDRKIQSKGVGPKVNSIPIVVMGVGMLGIGAGVVLGIVGQEEADYANSGKAGSQIAVVDAQGLGLGANLAFVIGGAVVAGGLTWLIVDIFGQSKKKVPVNASFVPSASGANLWLSGSF